MFERFTVGAREVVTTAVAEASSLGHPAVGPEHVLLGLLHPGVGVGREVLNDAGLTADRVRDAVRRRSPASGFPTADDAESLRSVGIDLDEVMARLEQTLGADALAPAAARRGGRRFTPVAKKTLQLALREAVWLKSGAIGSEHVLLGLLRCEDKGISALLAELGVEPDDLRRTTLSKLGRAA